jgi:hypothetical protein
VEPVLVVNEPVGHEVHVVLDDAPDTVEKVFIGHGIHDFRSPLSKEPDEHVVQELALLDEIEPGLHIPQELDPAAANVPA